MEVKNRKSPRIHGYDYSSQNYYFVTICCNQRKSLFGSVEKLNTFGMIAETMIQEICMHYENIVIDKYVVMPNHVHMIVVINDNSKRNSLDTIIGLYKSGVTRKIRKYSPNISVWQRSFHDRVIRCQAEYEKVWSYIDTNPQRWSKDCFYIEECEEYTGLGGSRPSPTDGGM
jgi:REP element-mobilizing transposase RayT